MAKCSLCGSKYPFGVKPAYSYRDQEKTTICRHCARIYGENTPPDFQILKEAWAKNDEKVSHFSVSAQFELAFKVIAYLDKEHQWFYLDLATLKLKPLLFDCNNLLSIQIEDNGRMITTTKGSMGGAIVGGLIAGPVGAIAGQHAGTSYTAKEHGEKLALLHVQNEFGAQEIKIYQSRPAAIAAFQKSVMDIINPLEETTKLLSISSPADEIKKYKELLDMGAITQDEYDAKKKQLLDL